MEFEIEEDLLLDPSTNPSLVHRPRPGACRRPGARRTKEYQKAVLIPEEEDQLA